MHRVLLVSELLSILFVYVKLQDPSNSKRTLAHCARTCKAWYEPATRVLWHELDSLLPLLQSFPRDAFSDSTRKDPGLWRFKRTLRPRDWSEFTRRAPFIRSLAFREGHDVLSSAIVALDVQRPYLYRANPLLPNLSSLDWTVHNSSTLTLLLAFVSPSLTSININFASAKPDQGKNKSSTSSDPNVSTPTRNGPEAERNDAAGGLLCTLVDLAPHLREIHLHIEHLWAVSDVVNPLNALPSLQTLHLDVGSIGPFILRGLCLHPSLRTLVVDLRGIDESFLAHLLDVDVAHNTARQKMSGTRREFVSLRDVTVLAEMHIVQTTMEMLLGSAALDAVCIRTTTDGPAVPAEAFGTLLSTLANTSPDLQELRIEVTTSGGSPEDTLGGEEEATAALLLPLMTLKRLRIVDLRLGPTKVRGLDDADLMMLLGALPDVEEFTLNEGIAAPSRRATVRLLEWVAEHKRGIRTLGIPLDFGLGWDDEGEPIAAAADVVQQKREATLEVEDRSEDRASKTVTPLTPPLTPEGSLILSTTIIPSVEEEVQTSSSLETLCLGTSSMVPAGHNERVAGLLKRLFPRLRRVGLGLLDGSTVLLEGSLEELIGIKFPPSLSTRGERREASWTRVEASDVEMDG